MYLNNYILLLLFFCFFFCTFQSSKHYSLCAGAGYVKGQGQKVKGSLHFELIILNNKTINF